MSNGKQVRASSRRAGVVVKAVAGTAVVAAVVGGIAMVGGGSRGSGTGSAAGLTADRAAVKRAAFEISTTANGELEARNQIEVRSELDTPSTITEIIPEGTAVKKGDLLVKLNGDKLETQVTDLTAQVDTAKAEMTTAENNYQIQVNDNAAKLRQAETKLQLSEIALQQWINGDVKQRRQEIDLALEKARRDLDRLTTKLGQSKLLYEKNFLSKNEFELDEIAKIEAEAALEKAKLDRETYENYTFIQEQKKNQSDVDDAKAELERVKLNASSELANKDAALKRAIQKLTQAEIQLAKFTKQLESCTIKAPSDGLVVYGTSMERSRWGWGGDGPLQIGREVFPNMLLMALPDTSEMVASVKVHESLAGRIKPGLAATVKVDAAGGRTFTGKVESIGVLAESGGFRDPNLREYTVKIALQDVEPGSGLKPSMRCEAQVMLGKVDESLTVPIQAVFSDGAVRFVYTSEGMKFSKVPVKLGQRSDTTAEIAAGLSDGQIVLLREPAPGEILSKPWDKAQLELTGYALDADGVPIAAGGKGGPGGASGGEGRGKRGEGKRGERTGAPGAIATDGKPAGDLAAPKPTESAAPATGGEPTVADATKNAEAGKPDSAGSPAVDKTTAAPAKPDK